jgi:predicted branched-subunit amino acid permease
MQAMTTALTRDNRAAFVAGCRHAFGVPAAVLVAGMIGFGALGHASGLSLGVTAATTLFMYALPGQVVFVEMMAVGASGLAIALAVGLTAARFLPMTMTLLPYIPKEDRSPSLYAKSHLISMTSWAVMMRDFASLQPAERLPYFTGFGLVCWASSVPGTVLGYLLAGYVPTPITLGLVMINPLFFLLTFTEVKTQSGRLALLIGGLAGPLVYGVSPSWSILICGLAGGTLAFLIDTSLRAKKKQ